MIVKNESHVIKRCLDSVKRLLDYVLIIDTGSDDNTPEIIEKWLVDNNLPGEVIIEPWKDFSYNRTFALNKLFEKETIDYALMIDADEILVFDDSFDLIDFKSNLYADIYDVTTNMSGLMYTRPTLTSNKVKFKYEGVVHEFLAMPESNLSRDKAIGFFNRPIQDSDRNRDQRQKFLNDAKLIENELGKDISEWFRSRYTFYLAQCYRDAGEIEKSLENYLIRSKQGFWLEEVFISLYSAGKLMKDLKYDKSNMIQTWMDAYEIAPHRGESLWSIMQYCRINGMNYQGYIIGKQAINISYPLGSLFVEKWIYDYGILDEFSILSYWTGNYSDSKWACEKLLTEKKIPDHYYDRVKYNLNFSIEKLK
jgi:glycosyltransferase involved in cell wall biosynthesis